MIIAPSFADIFYNNCFKTGMLPVALPQSDIDQLMKVAQRGEDIAVDLQEQSITFGNSQIKFDIDGFRKHNLLNGLDDIGLTLEKADNISKFEGNQGVSSPWLYKYGTNFA